MVVEESVRRKLRASLWPMVLVVVVLRLIAKISRKGMGTVECRRSDWSCH